METGKASARVELAEDTLVFSFPEVYPAARLRVTFQRTLRIPDDGRAYDLPPGLPWFSWYDESLVPIQGSRRLARLKSVADMARAKHRQLPPGNEPADVKHVVQLSGGTGHTIRVCLEHNVPVVTQSMWLHWR